MQLQLAPPAHKPEVATQSDDSLVCGVQISVIGAEVVGVADGVALLGPSRVFDATTPITIPAIASTLNAAIPTIVRFLLFSSTPVDCVEGK